MIYGDREGNFITNDSGQDKFLRVLYTTTAGRMVLRPLISPWVSKFGGWVLNRRISALAIKPFVEKNGILMEQYEQEVYCSYNDFFKRKIMEECRPIAGDPNVLISPCDAKVSVYPITKQGVFAIKNTMYTVKSLLRSGRLSDYYEGGTLFVFRLTVDDYHRFCYVADGKKSRNYRIPGIFHTVNPIANDIYPIYKENTREFSLLKTKEFGTITVMEVGALLVGKIVNYQEAGLVKRGQEKGCFEFGGSTIVMLLPKNRVIPDEMLVEHTKKGYETIVKMGEPIGKRNM